MSRPVEGIFTLRNGNNPCREYEVHTAKREDIFFCPQEDDFIYIFRKCKSDIRFIDSFIPQIVSIVTIWISFFIEYD